MSEKEQDRSHGEGSLSDSRRPARHGARTLSGTGFLKALLLSADHHMHDSTFSLAGLRQAIAVNRRYFTSSGIFPGLEFGQ